jgi:WD40 repeat protein/serine/threonine protein kinase
MSSSSNQRGHPPTASAPGAGPVNAPGPHAFWPDGFPTAAGELTPAQWAAWARAHQQERWRRGDRIPAEAYLQLHPALQGSPDEVFDVIYGEILLREELGESPPVEEYLERFPHFATRLRRQVQFHLALESDFGPDPLEDGRLAPPGHAPTISPAGERLRIRGYEVLEELGRGSTGVAYKAWQVDLKRPVALKMIRRALQADPEVRARFRTEVEAVARLRHPHIVQIYEVGEHEGTPFFSMEYVEGGSLAERLDGRPYPPREAAAFVATLAGAVAYAHQRGILHRDLKPANILLALDPPPASSTALGGAAAPAAGQAGLTAWTPKVADFGLARHLDAGTRLTGTGMVLGTPAYMAPEQSTGRCPDAGPPTDVYALGAILYELLTGGLPFPADSSLEMLLLARAGDPAPPTRRQPQVPRDLETICLKCLQKEPHRRYRNAQELAQDLGRFLTYQPIKARPAGPGERLWRRCQRNPWVAGLTVAVFLALLAGTSLATYFALEASKQARQAEASAAQARQENEISVRRLYISDLRQAGHAWDQGQVSRLQELLAGQQPDRTGGKDLRCFEWYYWWHLCRTELLTLQAHAGLVGEVAFSPDGRRLASAGVDGTVCVWDAATGALCLQLPSPVRRGQEADFPTDDPRVRRHRAMQRNRALDLTPEQQSLLVRRQRERVVGLAYGLDDRHLAAAYGNSSMVVWDTTTGQVALTVQADTAQIFGLAYRQDGRQLAAACLDGSVRVWDASTGQIVFRLRGHRGIVRGVAFSPDGSHLASAGVDHMVKVWDVRVSKPQAQTLRGHSGPVTSVAFSPDGRRLASASADQLVKVWDVANVREELTLRGHSGTVLRVAFSGDGRRLASAGEDHIVKVWDLTNPPKVITLKGHTDKVLAVCFRPDGGRLASASSDRTVKLWDPLSDKEALTLRSEARVVHRVAFDGTGRFLAAAGGDMATDGHGVVEVWDAAAGKKIQTLRGHTGVVFDVAFSPDGRYLASAGADQTIKVWDAVDWREVRTLTGHTDFVRSLAFDPGSRFLASAGWDKSVRLWDLDHPQEVRVLEGHTTPIQAIAVSPDGRRLVSAGSDGTARVWDLTTGRELLLFRRHQQAVFSAVLCVAFSPDGRSVASAGADETVKVWDATTGDERLTFPTGGGRFHSVAFSPGGRRLAATSWSQTVKLWDLEGGQEVLSLKGHPAPVHSVAFSPDGQRLASAGGDGIIKVWCAPAGP